MLDEGSNQPFPAYDRPAQCLLGKALAPFPSSFLAVLELFLASPSVAEGHLESLWGAPPDGIPGLNFLLTIHVGLLNQTKVVGGHVLPPFVPLGCRWGTFFRLPLGCQ